MGTKGCTDAGETVFALVLHALARGLGNSRLYDRGRGRRDDNVPLGNAGRGHPRERWCDDGEEESGLHRLELDSESDGASEAVGWDELPL